MKSWVVKLEATPALGAGPIEAEHVLRLIEAVQAHPAGLHCADRCALQLTAAGSTQAEALFTALSRWEAALPRLELPPLEVVRTEVLTPEEFAAELEDLDALGMLDVALAVGQEVPSTSGAEELIRRALSDPLTTLENREVFLNRLAKAVSGPARLRPGLAVLCLDLDGFGAINERLGVSGGDEVLVVVGQRLSSIVRHADVIARLGADQFGVLLDDVGDSGLAVVADRLLADLRQPLAVRDDELRLTAALGVARSTSDQDTAQELLDRAMAATWAAKAAGGNCWKAFERAPAIVPPRVRHTAEGVHDHFAYIVLLQQAAIAANESECLEEAAHVVLTQVCKFTGSAVGHLYLVSPEQRAVLAPWAARHEALPGDYEALRQATECLTLTTGVGLPGRVMETGAPVWVRDVRADGDFPQSEEAVAAGLLTAFAAPVLVGTELVAVLELYSPGPLERNGALLEVLANIGTQLGRVVERTRAREALESSRARLQEAQAIGRLGSWHRDLRTGETTWSDELYEILGLDPVTPPSVDQFVSMVHPDDRQTVERDATVNGGSEASDPLLEFQVVRPDGGVRWIARRRSTARDGAANVVAVHTTMQDVTEHKQATECALTCEIRWHLLLQGSMEILSLLTPDGRMFFSLVPALMPPLVPGDGELPALADVVHPDDAHVVRHVLAELLADPDTHVAFQARFPGEDGWRWFESIATNLLDEPLIGSIVVNSHDVTQEKELVERLNELVEGDLAALADGNGLAHAASEPVP